jgi:hypothetical protein
VSSNRRSCPRRPQWSAPRRAHRAPAGSSSRTPSQRTFGRRRRCAAEPVMGQPGPLPPAQLSPQACGFVRRSQMAGGHVTQSRLGPTPLHEKWAAVVVIGGHASLPCGGAPRGRGCGLGRDDGLVNVDLIVGPGVPRPRRSRVKPGVNLGKRAWIMEMCRGSGPGADRPPATSQSGKGL